MNKLISILLLFVMMTTMLVSCGPQYEEVIEEDENKETIGGGDIIGGWDEPDDSTENPDNPNNPGTDDPGTDNPGTDNPGTDNPGTDDPGTDDPGTDDPGTDDPDIDPDLDPDPNKVTVYLINRANWEKVSIYYWGGMGEITGGWPGAELTIGTNLLYKASLETKFTKLIFNNTSGIQTADLNVPKDDKIVYDNKDNVWITFDEAIELLKNEGLEPHSHNFIEGKCECGEVDPDYKADCPHDYYDVSEKAPTCTSKGSKTYTCTACGYNYSTSIPATGHQNVVTVPGREATCGEAGLSDGEQCLDCGTYTVKQSTISATGDHNFIGGICLDCGKEEPNLDDDLDIFYALFDETSYVSIKLDISNSELKKMQKDFEACYKSPIYRMANLIVTIKTADGKTGTWTIPQVGVRMKGNTSRTNFYSDSDGMYNLIHFKVSFQETFDNTEYYGSDALTWTDANARKERKNRTFATLEKIDMRWNKNDDTTYIREQYAYELYREFDVLAPHTTLASVDIGKDHAGVFMIYEPIDKVFLEKNLPAEALGGDLYKLGWTSEGATFTSFSSYGVEDELANKFYVYDLKTNKKTSDHSSLKNLINTIKSSSVSKETFASVVDMENFINYCAVSYMIGNPDDLRNNYNNSYIYFRADTGKMIVIPYDMDRGLGINRDWNPYGDSQTTDSPFSTKMVSGDQRSPLFLRTVCQGGMFLNEYKEALKAVDASEMLTKARFEESFNIAKSLYGNETKPSKNYGNAGGHRFYFDNNSSSNSNNMSFGKYLDAKRATLYKYLGDQGNTDNSGSGDSGNDNNDNGGNSYQPITNCDPYVVGDMNNWQPSSKYKMTSNGDGTFSFTLTTSDVSSTYNRIKFKIFDNNSGGWYGYEIVDPNCEVNPNDITNNANGNKNIYLAPGTYVITFDPSTVTLYIEKQ